MARQNADIPLSRFFQHVFEKLNLRQGCLLLGLPPAGRLPRLLQPLPSPCLIQADCEFANCTFPVK